MFYNPFQYVLFQAHNKMIELLDNEGLERSTESFSSDPEMALKNLKVIIVRFVLGRQRCTCMSICNTRTRELL